MTFHAHHFADIAATRFNAIRSAIPLEIPLHRARIVLTPEDGPRRRPRSLLIEAIVEDPGAFLEEREKRHLQQLRAGWTDSTLAETLRGMHAWVRRAQLLQHHRFGIRLLQSPPLGRTTTHP
jgi:hypothetical protein